jgi:Protein of unknown function (DUF2938)
LSNPSLYMPMNTDEVWTALALGAVSSVGLLVGAIVASFSRLPHHAIAMAMSVGAGLERLEKHAIGIVLTGVYVWALSYAGRSPGNLVLALAFGLSTNVLPWLLMFPSMGYGFFGSHGPAGTRLFLSSLMSRAFSASASASGARSVELQHRPGGREADATHVPEPAR